MKRIIFAVVCLALGAVSGPLYGITPQGIFPYQPPEARPFFKITATSIVAAWGPGTNDASSRYECQNIDTSDFLPPSSGALSWESSWLIPETPYSFRARAWDDNATPPSATAWTELGTAYTAGNIKIQGKPVSDGDTISGIPDITFSFKKIAAIDGASCAVLVNGIPVSDGLSANGMYDNIEESSGSVTVYYTPKSKLPGAGKKTITVRINDLNGTLYTESASNLSVRDSSDTELRLTSLPLCYPNPFNPASGGMKISYHLSADGDINIFMVDATGKIIFRERLSSGENGARYGYNEAPWDGRNAYGETVSNDVYLIFIADTSGRVLGKTRVMVLK